MSGFSEPLQQDASNEEKTRAKNDLAGTNSPAFKAKVSGTAIMHEKTLIELALDFYGLLISTPN